MISIDGQDISTTWGLEPLYDGVYSPLMKFPDAKEYISNDFLGEDGIDLLIEPIKYKSSEITLQFVVDTYTHYKAFIAYMIANPVVHLTTDLYAIDISLEYMSCSSYNKETFAIKVREANYNNRDWMYIITELGLRLITEDGNQLIM